MMYPPESFFDMKRVYKKELKKILKEN